MFRFFLSSICLLLLSLFLVVVVVVVFSLVSLVPWSRTLSLSCKDHEKTLSDVSLTFLKRNETRRLTKSNRSKHIVQQKFPAKCSGPEGDSGSTVECLLHSLCGFRQDAMTPSACLSCRCVVIRLLVLLFLHDVILPPLAAASHGALSLRGSSPSAMTSCPCCDVSLTSACCLHCLAGNTHGAGWGPLGRGSKEGKNGELQWEAGQQLLQHSAVACQCCFEGDDHPKQPLVHAACCSVCLRTKDVSDAVTHTLVSHDLSPLASQRDASDDVPSAMASVSVQKRMTSMECMCCMNSGIAQCCSECKIY